MPTINLNRLHDQIQDVLAHVDDPTRFSRKVLDVLEFYADRSKRPGSVAGSLESRNVLNVPKPVLRELKRAIETLPIEETENWVEMAGYLWEAGYREHRYIASVILGLRADEDMLELAEQWAEQSHDSYELVEVSSIGLRQYRLSHPDTFYGAISRWLNTDSQKVRHLGLLSIQHVLEEGGNEVVPVVLSLLQGASGWASGSSWKTLRSLIENLALSSAPETARFLLKEIENEPHNSRRLIQTSLMYFPEVQKHRLEETLKKS